MLKNSTVLPLYFVVSFLSGNFSKCFFYIKYSFFHFKNAVNTFYNLNYDYWDSIIIFWQGSMKWNTPKFKISN